MIFIAKEKSCLNNLHYIGIISGFGKTVKSEKMDLNAYKVPVYSLFNYRNKAIFQRYSTLCYCMRKHATHRNEYEAFSHVLHNVLVFPAEVRASVFH